MLNLKTRRLLAALMLTAGLMLISINLVVAQDDGGESDANDLVATEEPGDSVTEGVTDSMDEAADDAPSGVLDPMNTENAPTVEPTGNNGYCTICHNQPLRTTSLADGTQLNLFVNPDMIIGSVHGPSEDSPGLGCLDCHGEDSFPHNEPPPANGRLYTIESVQMCLGCHTTAAEDLSMGLHTEAIQGGNLEAAVCTDCHGAHHVQTIENFPELVAGVCGDCHENTLAEWQISPHAEIGPLGCASCHDHHAQTLRVGETSTDLCLNCHGEGQMPEIYSHTTHLEGENPVDCVACHMYTDDHPDQLASLQTTSVLDAESTGHSMLLDSTPCTTCHANLVESGEWQQIVVNRYQIDLAADETSATTDADTTDAQDDDDDDDNTLGIIQGLLVGLGLGVTFSIVFLTRNLRRNS